jgi:hypothetical protein
MDSLLSRIDSFIIKSDFSIAHQQAAKKISDDYFNRFRRAPTTKEMAEEMKKLGNPSSINKSRVEDIHDYRKKLQIHANTSPNKDRSKLGAAWRTEIREKNKDKSLNKGDKPNIPGVAWDSLTPIQQAQLKKLRPELFFKKGLHNPFDNPDEKRRKHFKDIKDKAIKEEKRKITKEQIIKKSIGNDELAQGIEVEKEHTDNLDIAEKIARDHLAERPDYYSRLKEMEALPVKKMGETSGFGRKGQSIVRQKQKLSREMQEGYKELRRRDIEPRDDQDVVEAKYIVKPVKKDLSHADKRKLMVKIKENDPDLANGIKQAMRQRKLSSRIHKFIEKQEQSSWGPKNKINPQTGKPFKTKRKTTKINVTQIPWTEKDKKDFERRINK